MAHHKQSYIRLAYFFAAVVMGLAFTSTASAKAKYQKPQRHFLSWESENRPEEYRRWAKKRTSLRRLKVSRDRVAKLKKSSFWNKRPYQFSTPIVDGDRLYVGSDSGRFYLINANNESKIWEFKSDGAIGSKAALADNTVYFGDSKAMVYALDAETGAEKWRSRLDAEVLSTPLVYGGRLFVVDMSGRLYALDRNSGVPVWHTNPNDKNIGFSVRGSSSPTAAAGFVIIGSASGNLIAYKESSGELAWIRQLGNRQTELYDIDSAPLVVGNHIYVASADGRVFCVEPSTGNVVWEAEAGGANDLTLHDGRIYASGGGVLTSLDPSNGSIFWQQDLETPEISSPAAGEHYIAVVSTKDKFYLIDDESGDIIYDRFIRKGSFGDPVIVGDKLYVLANTGALYSFGVRELPPRKVKTKKTKGE